MMGVCRPSLPSLPSQYDEIDGSALSVLGCQGESQIRSVHSIEDEMIPEESLVVFDWDNTLKVIDNAEKKITGRVTKDFLQRLVKLKGCDLYIISAIRPSQLNIETLLTEMGRLDMIDSFCAPEDRTKFGKRKEIRYGDLHWVQEGNIIICGYDKAEVFSVIIKQKKSADKSKSRPIVFFDDEEVNIVNFSSMIPGSQCYKIET